MGILDVGREVMTTSSSGLLLLLGLSGSTTPKALLGEGEFSLRNEDGSLERGVSRVGERYLPLPPLEEGVDGTGELGSDFSSVSRVTNGGRRAAGGE